ncbi:MAG: Tol-Pal system protein TolB [Simkaniaceae bacterium]|nr:Tol-Pal system protein TolB [Simkaniaceae bacterium]
MKHSISHHRLFGLVLLFSFLHAEEKEMIIPLSTRKFLSSVYVSPFSSPSFSEEYLQALRRILVFDINTNGSCHVEKKGRHDCKIDVAITEKELTALIVLTRGRITKTLGPYVLTGNLSKDRALIHQFSDDLTLLMTGTRGIAHSKILFSMQFPEKTARGYTYKSEIWEIDYDGENKKPVTRENSYCITPAFFPTFGSFTENKFLYVNYKNGQPKIYLGSFKDERGKPLVHLRGNQLLPAVSNRGDMIAFISDASGRADLFVQLFSKSHGLMGKPIQAYSYPKSVQASPTFRPDGKKIAFVSDKNGSPRIFIIDTPYPGKETTTKSLCITKKYRHNTCPCWSPDGTKLAYSAMIDGTRQIMLYDFLTKEEIQLTTGGSHKENPSWAPNSLHLIYNTVDPSSSELFMVNLKQKEMIQITTGPGKKHYPAWEPTRGPL